MNRFELWDKVARCPLQQHFRLVVALWWKASNAFMSAAGKVHVSAAYISTESTMQFSNERETLIFPDSI